MQQAVVLDKIDLKILQVLQENGRLSNVELSERVALSPSPCLRRLKQLEDNGIIRRYAALLSPVSLGLGLQVMIKPRNRVANLKARCKHGRKCWAVLRSRANRIICCTLSLPI